MISIAALFAVGLESTADEIVSTDIMSTLNESDSFREKKNSFSLNDMGSMRASWYGPKFHGKLTANGEIYNQMALTAAHKTLPFGTMLRLTNKNNNKSVIVRINDRGPYIKGREIDLSRGAALALNSVQAGVVEVEVEQIELDDEFSPFVYK